MNFTGNGTAMVPGSRWQVFESLEGKVNRTVRPEGTVTGNTPPTLGLVDVLVDDFPQGGDGVLDSLFVQLAEILPPPDGGA